MNHKCIVTAASYNWLPRAFVMVESVLDHNPGCDAIILVADMSHARIANLTWPGSASVRMLGFDRVDHPALQKMRSYFNQFELCCAAKSFLVNHAIFEENYSQVLMLDPDIFCYDSLTPIWSILDQADMAVTPHIDSPLPEDGCLPDDREFVNSGFINGGFWAVARTAGAEKSLHWLMDKVAHFGFFAPHINLYADQTWMSCLPWFFPEGTAIVRNPGINVAYWNLHERQLSQRAGDYFSNGKKLIFLHFSGFDTENPDRLTIHTDRRFDEDTERVLSSLVKDYGARVAKAAKAFPMLQPDLASSDLSLAARIKSYQNAYGDKAKYAPEIEEPFIARVANKFRKKYFHENKK